MVQLTPSGSWCSVQFGANVASDAPGSGKGYLVASDIEATLDKLAAAGIDVDEVYQAGFHGDPATPTGARSAG